MTLFVTQSSNIALLSGILTETCQVRTPVSAPAIFVVFFTSCQYMSEYYLNSSTTASYQILSKSQFTRHPIVRRYTTSDNDGAVN